MQPRAKTVLSLITGAVVGVMPAYFGYLANRDEIKAKYQQTQDEATGGYAALAASVKELQTSVTVQHDYIIKLETHLDDMDKYTTAVLEERHVAPSTHVRPKPPVPPTKPTFGDLPHDFPDAAAKFAPKR